ncbi:uncharacterized protein LOC125846565 isoform X2 [Solanum stenotomum]|uniref:uncharacterized protein LOC125846565 isoform X2 n=1 Tax=Solanum stenotomum TaxID=172797 RepID=UPI0020D09C1A|nr:uncharacterized protein LOC125846565 isoform X2 [Solanum stenotomum]
MRLKEHHSSGESQYRMVNEELKKSPKNPKTVNGENREGLFSPRFKSVAAMAGWDEEALLIASFVVEETPDRQHKQKKLTGLQHFVTPPSNSRRKRRAQKRSPASIHVAVIDLDDDDTAKTENEKKKPEQKFTGKGDKEGVEASEEYGSCVSSSGSAILCTDRLREELSCAICLEICFEPSTTPCGHSFCRKCLQSAADKCGTRCPKCRQLISNGRSCTVNTVLWNTIQLLFPKEVEARKAAGTLNSKEVQHQNPSKIVASHSNVSRSRTVRALASLHNPDSGSRNPQQTNFHSISRSRIDRILALHSPDSGSQNAQQRNSHSMRRQNVRPSGTSSRNGNISTSTRRESPPRQDEDAALALQLQREEHKETFRTRRSDKQYKNALALARANLRAMASTAINNIRVRGRGA